MSEYIGLGESDADQRWIGVRRHQGVLCVVGVGVVAEGVLHSSRHVLAVVIGVAIMSLAAPARDGLTLGELALHTVQFWSRSHWNALGVFETDGDVVFFSGSGVATRLYTFDHRGRLDLTGEDVAGAASLAAMADALAAGRNNSHFSQHVVCREYGNTTLLGAPSDARVPEGWRANDNALAVLVGTANQRDFRHLERLTYLRGPTSLRRLYRVRDFSAVPASLGLLEKLLRSAVAFDLSVHVEVVSSTKAHRLSARAVHRVGSDDEASRSAGFRRTARSSRGLNRLAQRESAVASGRALLRIAVYVQVRGASLEELLAISSSLWSTASDAGLRLERGWGRQARWYRAQLPGGVGW